MKTLTILLIGIVLAGCAKEPYYECYSHHRHTIFYHYNFKIGDNVVSGYNSECYVIDSLDKTRAGYYYATSVNVTTFGRHSIINDYNTIYWPGPKYVKQ